MDDLRNGTARERAAGDHALERLRVGRANQPDPVARGELHVVAAATEHARILVGPGDTCAAPLLVHVEQDVLVVTEVVPIADRVPELLPRVFLGGLAVDDLVELGERLRQIGIDAKALDVAPHHGVLEVRGDVRAIHRWPVTPLMTSVPGQTSLTR